MKKSLCILLAIIITVMTASAAMPVSAKDAGDMIGLIEGTYVQGQVVVMFRDDTIVADRAPDNGGPAVGKNYGKMMSAFSAEGKAIAAAGNEADILAQSLGDDFVLEDTLVFADSGLPSDGGLAPSGADADAVQSGDLTVALVSSEKYDTADMIRMLSGNPKVAAVEPNQYIYLTDYDDYALNDTYASYLYQLNSPAAKNTAGAGVNSRGTDPEKALSMNTASAWSKLTGDEDEIVIAVADTGVLDTHEDLKDRMWTNPGNIGLKGEHGYNFYENNENSAYDDVGHGTHCAGMIAAEANNATGVAGAVNGSDVKIMALRILGEKGSSTIYQTLGAYDYILKAKQSGVNIVASNNSWGGTYYSAVFDEAVDRMGEAGILTIIAAGNDSYNLERIWDFPTNTQSDYSVVVGAADITGKPTSFTNYGKTTVDLFAPGLNILSTVAYESYFPFIYTVEELSLTTGYYGEFGADTVVNGGTVTPTTGAKADDGVKSFGSLQYVKQSCLADADLEIADDARLELELVSGVHNFTDNPYRLRITIHDAQYGEEYYLWFPYEKDPLTTGDDNTRFSATYEVGEVEEGYYKSRISVGDVYEDEEGRMAVSNGGVMGNYVSYNRMGLLRHPTNRTELGKAAAPSALLSAEEAQGKQIGFGMRISCMEGENMLWEEGEVHDLVLYLDSVAISKPGAQFDRNTAYDVMSGTSMACPAATGATALLALLNPREEGQSGAEYARALREKLFSCVRTTDEFADLCSTGGYIDLSLLDAHVPAVANAVCDVDNETITLYGENLTQDNTLTYRRILYDVEAAELPEGMTLAYSDDGKTLTIQNAKPLFSTYTEFIVTTPSGLTGKGKFFLVKGQRQFDYVGSRIENYYDDNIPYLITDAGGSALFGYNYETGEVAKFDGAQFYYLPETKLRTALNEYLADNGMSMYDLLNNQNYRYYLLNTGMPLTDGDMLNAFIIFCDIENYLFTLYRGQLDLSEENLHWTFEEVEFFPDDIGSSSTPLTMAVYQGTVYVFSDPDEEGKCAVFSLRDGAWVPEPVMPSGSVCPIVKESSGKLYYMFGTSDDPSLSIDDAFIKDVYSFDGEKWEKAGSIPYIGRYHYDDYSNELVYAPVTTVKNGFVFIGASVDGGGNAFLYNTVTDKVEPLYYSANDTIADCYYHSASCVATKDGIYYIRFCTREYIFSGYDLYLLPADSGAYESAFEDEIILGDADGDGAVSILDATAIQRTLAGLPAEAYNEAAADTDGDGEVTIFDATAIQRWLVNLPANENIGKPIK